MIWLLSWKRLSYLDFFLLLKQLLLWLLGSYIRIPKSNKQNQNILKRFTHSLMQARILVHLFTYSRPSIHPFILSSSIYWAPYAYLFIQSMNIYRAPRRCQGTSGKWEWGKDKQCDLLFVENLKTITKSTKRLLLL